MLHLTQAKALTKWFAISLLVVLIAFPVVSVFFAPPEGLIPFLRSDHQRFLAKFKEIQPDMTEAQVDVILSGHRCVTVPEKRTETALGIPLARPCVKLKVFEEHPNDVEGREIEIFLDEDGHVIHKELVTIGR
jgi:hypothetical protein